MVLPSSKRQKAPKTAWTRCPSRFFTIPPSAQQVAPPPFAMETKRLIYFYSARFSHFIDSLTADTHAGGFDNIMHIKIRCFSLFYGAQ